MADFLGLRLRVGAFFGGDSDERGVGLGAGFFFAGDMNLIGEVSKPE
jgi:hypothetical protein